MLKNLFLPIVLTGSLILAACTTMPLTRQVLIACQGYASILTALAVTRAAGRLTDVQVGLVDALRPGLNKICLDGNFSDPVVALDLVQDGMFKLIQMERGL